MKTLPILPYNGLTIILENPSRFDIKNNSLLSGPVSNFVDINLGAVSRFGCLITTPHEYINLPEGTKIVLLLGEGAHNLIHKNRGVSLMAQRGSPYVKDGVIYISSFFPQDCEDRKDYEGEYNSMGGNWGGDEDDSKKVEKDSETKGTKGSTRRVNWKFWLRHDIKKAARLLTEGIKLGEYKTQICYDPEEAINLLTNTKNANLYLDIETTFDLTLTCVGISFSGDCLVIPFYQTHLAQGGYFFGEKDTCRILRALAIAFRDNTVVVHNAMFDLLVMSWKYRLPLPSKVVCTMIAHHRNYPEVEKSLGHVLSLYTDQPYHKNEGVFHPYTQSQAEQLYAYNGKDVLALPLILDGIYKTADRLKSRESIKQGYSMITPYLEATLQGMRVDNTKRREMIDECEKKRFQMCRISSLLTSDIPYAQKLDNKGKRKILAGFNPHSWQQVAKYLYMDMGLPEPIKDKTNSKTLLQLYIKTRNPVIPIILEARAQGKNRGDLDFSTYPGVNFYIKNTSISDRITCSWKLTGTNTFRLSSAALLGEYGRNVQNFSGSDRRCIIPDEGKEFVQVDQSGAEALILAYLTRHGNYRELFLNKVKPHVFVGLHVFRKEFEDRLGFSLSQFISAPIKELTKLPRWEEVDKIIKASDKWPAKERYYYIAKMICHASNYGMKAPTFRKNVLEKSEGKVMLELSETQKYLNTYHSLFPEIQQWHADTITELRKYRILRNLFGFPRVFSSPESDNLFREAYAFKPQSTVGCITNICFVELKYRERCNQVFIDCGVDTLQNNHDSVLLQCNIGKGEKIGRITQGLMNQRLVNERGEEFYMKSGLSIGNNWGEMKEI